MQKGEICDPYGENSCKFLELWIVSLGDEGEGHVMFFEEE